MLDVKTWAYGAAEEPEKGVIKAAHTHTSDMWVPSPPPGQNAPILLKMRQARRVPRLTSPCLCKVYEKPFQPPTVGAVRHTSFLVLFVFCCSC